MLHFSDKALIGLTSEQAKDFSFVNLLVDARNVAFGNKPDGFEYEASQAYARQMPDSLRTSPNQTWIPGDVLKHQADEHYDLDTAATGKGKELVGTDLLTQSFVEYLFNESIFVPRVSTYFDTEMGDINIPKAAKGTMEAQWLTEVAEKTVNDDPAFSVIEMKPRRISARTDFSWRLEKNSEVFIEGYIRMMIARTLAQAIDFAYLYGTGGANNQPLGHESAAANSTTFGTNGVTTDRLTYNALVKMPSMAQRYSTETVATAMNYVYLANWRQWEDLVSAPRLAPEAVTNAGYAASPYKMMYEGTNYESIEVAGLPMIFGNQVATNNIHLLDFSNVITKHWGGISVTVDPYTVAASAQTRVIVDVWMDVNWFYPETLVHMDHA